MDPFRLKHLPQLICASLLLIASGVLIYGFFGLERTFGGPPLPLHYTLFSHVLGPFFVSGMLLVMLTQFATGKPALVLRCVIVLLLLLVYCSPDSHHAHDLGHVIFGDCSSRLQPLIRCFCVLAGVSTLYHWAQYFGHGRVVWDPWF